MKYLKKYKLFESINTLVEDIKDIFLDLLEDDGLISKVDVEKRALGYAKDAAPDSDDNDIRVKFYCNDGQTISSFFNSESFKRAYNLLNREGYTIYYLYVSVSGHQVINKSSLSFEDPTPWVEFSNDNELDSRSTIEFEFHKPKNTLHVIWTNGKDMDDEEFDWDGVAFNKTREECNEIVKDMSQRGHPNCRIISDRKFWSLEPR